MESKSVCPAALVTPESTEGQLQSLRLQVLATFAGIANAVRPWKVARQFGLSRMKQGFGSGILEGRVGLIVPPRRDMHFRDPVLTTKLCQAAFLRDRVAPFLGAMKQMHTNCRLDSTVVDTLLRQASYNYQRWAEDEGESHSGTLSQSDRDK
ncbi:hypothetical protein KIPB_002874 [Kipferlia bialata]|uniref:Uncharacterized protein n=1 Tax=Kipferlia bialata TaxID=797122 RepID=A0A9K3CUI4_9EUKA|nr:hypothetical protein KIPB_002874 [Kipferlia bialata]|eukprot:g2874.t1